ncbi:hypothetical protein [Pigmentiphaga sp. CHJ604]|uniref:hypothetical protein n=1 Tax=Pigmentiphaga sp. CHJ604 TaxID=3081984 RepID=UPI0030D45F6C
MNVNDIAERALAQSMVNNLVLNAIIAAHPPGSQLLRDIADAFEQMKEHQAAQLLPSLLPESGRLLFDQIAQGWAEHLRARAEAKSPPPMR